MKTAALGWMDNFLVDPSGSKKEAREKTKSSSKNFSPTHIEAVFMRRSWRVEKKQQERGGLPHSFSFDWT